MATLSPYLMFNGNCKNAMGFYKECLGGTLEVMTYGSSPMGGQTPADMGDKVMHSYLESGAIHFMAADVPEGSVKHGNSVYLCLVCDTKEETAQLFSKLSAGGKVNRPLKEEFFGIYGEITDKFGLSWMFQFSPKKT